VKLILAFASGVLVGVSALLSWNLHSKNIEFESDREAAHELMDPQVPFHRKMSEPLNLPSQTESKNVALLHLMHRLADREMESQTFAYFLLGFFFLDRDRVLSEEYLRMHLREVPSDQEARRLLDNIERDKMGKSNSTISGP